MYERERDCESNIQAVSLLCSLCLHGRGRGMYGRRGAVRETKSVTLSGKLFLFGQQHPHSPALHSRFCGQAVWSDGATRLCCYVDEQLNLELSPVISNKWRCAAGVRLAAPLNDRQMFHIEPFPTSHPTPSSKLPLHLNYGKTSGDASSSSSLSSLL